ncbi:Uncharacterized protein HZ326_2192 [Fusarium oxysporum f. sp. albedinis]|nr:Uncharacterized protein HZ326_2192 [Fusarium oxysporum f. sp. albedinis]
MSREAFVAGRSARHLLTGIKNIELTINWSVPAIRLNSIRGCCSYAHNELTMSVPGSPLKDIIHELIAIPWDARINKAHTKFLFPIQRNPKLWINLHILNISRPVST